MIFFVCLGMILSPSSIGISIAARPGKRDVLKVKTLRSYALSFLGKPYRWGGEAFSYDCSGLVLEILKSAGAAPESDLSAQGIFDHFVGLGRTGFIGFGSLVFFGRSEREITHVGFMLDSFRMIEAGSGGRNTLTQLDAERQGAMVRVRPVASRKDVVGYVHPDYPRIMEAL